MSLLSTLLPRLQPYLPKCPGPVITQTLARIALDFCRRTNVWHEDLSAVTSVDGQSDYVLVSGYATARILQIDGVTVDGITHSYTFNRRTNTLALTSAPSADDLDIVPHVVYLPKSTILELPDELMELYGEVLVVGALGMLKGQSGMPWYDRRGASQNDAAYEDGVADVMIDELIDGGDGSLTMTVDHVL